MSVQLTRSQIVALEKIAEKECIGNYELKVSSTSSKGDGYLGIILTVNLIGRQKKLSLILKVAERNEELRKKIVIRKAYLREIFVYNKIFPGFQAFQRKHNMENSFSEFAKIYESCDEDRGEYLILENLKESGYKLWNRKIPMDSEHVGLVFSVYGKFHAASLAIREKSPDVFDELTKDFQSVFKDSYPKEQFEHAIKITLENGFKAVEGDKNATEALRRFSNVAATFLSDQLDLPEDSIVINHGDCWCNNIMFKYEDNNNHSKPTELCLIDWQLSKTGSPVLDLAYFFFVCSPKDVLYDYRKYLKIYHDTVSENLREMDCDPEILFPFEVLERHWKMYAKFGLYMALILIKLMLSEEDEVPVLNEIADSEESIFDSFNYEGIRIKDYNQRISDIITFMAEHELI